MWTFGKWSQLLGEFECLQSKRSTFDEWLQSPSLAYSRPLRILAFGASAALASMVLIGFATSLFPWSALVTWIVPILLLQSIIGLLFRNRMNRTSAGSSRLPSKPAF